MVKIIEIDDSVTLGEQFEAEVGAVILMNNFNVGPDDVEEELIKVLPIPLRSLSSNLGSFPLNCSEELLGVVHSLIMWDGNL
jgi:hypothetical protein